MGWNFDIKTEKLTYTDDNVYINNTTMNDNLADLVKDMALIMVRENDHFWNTPEINAAYERLKKYVGEDWAEKATKEFNQSANSWQDDLFRKLYDETYYPQNIHEYYKTKIKPTNMKEELFDYDKHIGKIHDENYFEWTDKKAIKFVKHILADYMNPIFTEQEFEKFLEAFKKKQSLNSESKKRKALFATQDGVEIFEGDKFWCVDNENWEVFERFGGDGLAYHIDEIRKRCFSTKEAAEQWIKDNKPTISYNQLRDYSSQYLHGLVGDILLKQFKPK